MTTRAHGRRVTVVLNPKSGAGAADVRAAIESHFRSHDIRTELLLVDGVRRDWTAELRCHAEDAAAIVAAGGDGTVNLVASAVAGTSTPMGVLPLGTLNHFARDIGIDSDLAAAIATVAAGTTVPVDLGDVNGRIFVNNCSIGVYPMIVHVRDELRRQGYPKWIAFAIAAKAVLERHPVLRVRLTTEDEGSTCHTPFVLVGNNAYDVAGLRMTGRTSLQGGRLFAYLAPDVPPASLPRRMLNEIMARLIVRSRTPREFHVISGEQIWIDADGPRDVRIAVDGEVTATTLPLGCRIRPRALHVLAPAGQQEAALSVAS